MKFLKLAAIFAIATASVVPAYSQADSPILDELAQIHQESISTSASSEAVFNRAQSIHQSYIVDSFRVKPKQNLIVGIGRNKNQFGVTPNDSDIELSTSEIARLKGNIRQSSQYQSLIKTGNLTEVDLLEGMPFIIVEADKQTYEYLKSNSYVWSIEFDFPVKLQTSKSAIETIFGLRFPWERSMYNGSNTWVAVIDSGVDVKHTMFKGKSIYQACFVTNRSCPNRQNAQVGGNAARPVDKHGTHVAGIAVGRYVPSQGISGVATKANLIAINIFENSYGNLTTYTSSILRGLTKVNQLASSKRIAAVNLSLGSSWVYYNSCDSVSTAVTSIITTLRKKKVATVVAAGNAGRERAISWPACITDAVAVSSSKKDGASSSFSNVSIRTSLSAPGSAIRSAIPRNRYATLSGTSMAAPHIAGGFAVVRKLKPSATVSAIETAMQNSSRRVEYGSATSYTQNLIWTANPILKDTVANVGGRVLYRVYGFGSSSSYRDMIQMGRPTWNWYSSFSSGSNRINSGAIATFGTNAQNTDSRAIILAPYTLFNSTVQARLTLPRNNAVCNYFQGGIAVKVGGAVSNGGALGGVYPGYGVPFQDGIVLVTNGCEWYPGKLPFEIIKYEHGERTLVLTRHVPVQGDVFTLKSTSGGNRTNFYVNGTYIGGLNSNRLIYGQAGLVFFKEYNAGSVGMGVDWLKIQGFSKNHLYH